MVQLETKGTIMPTMTTETSVRISNLSWHLANVGYSPDHHAQKSDLDPTTYFFDETQVVILRSKTFKDSLERLGIYGQAERELYEQIYAAVPKIGNQIAIRGLIVIRLANDKDGRIQILVAQ